MKDNNLTKNKVIDILKKSKLSVSVKNNLMEKYKITYEDLGEL